MLGGLRRDRESGRGDGWAVMGSKLTQIDYQVREMSEKMPMLDRVIKI